MAQIVVKPQELHPAEILVPIVPRNDVWTHTQTMVVRVQPSLLARQHVQSQRCIGAHKPPEGAAQPDILRRELGRR